MEHYSDNVPSKHSVTATVTASVTACNCCYGQSPAALQPLFTKSSPMHNFRRKMIFSLPKPRSDILKKSICYQAQELLTVYQVLRNLLGI